MTVINKLGGNIDIEPLITISTFDAVFGLFLFAVSLIAFKNLRTKKTLVFSLVSIIIAVVNILLLGLFFLKYFTFPAWYLYVAVIELVILLGISMPLFTER